MKHLFVILQEGCPSVNANRADLGSFINSTIWRLDTFLNVSMLNVQKSVMDLLNRYYKVQVVCFANCYSGWLPQNNNQNNNFPIALAVVCKMPTWDSLKPAQAFLGLFVVNIITHC